MRALTLVCCFGLSAVAAGGEPSPSFSRDIHPILSDKCFGCHGPSASDRKGKLRLDVPDGEFGALTPRGDDFIVKPGSPEESELWRRVTTDDPDDLMPPEESHKAPLDADERALIRQWILDGGEYQPFWSFIPPKRAPVSPLQNAAWSEHPIDQRVMARLEAEGLTPKAEADKRTLLRRLTFDLTGLPPTLEEIDAFLADERPDAYERVVDELLSRPSYGEHMTRYWADLVRLADTNGMHKDFPRDFTTYRDWLIRSFNNNLPFDEFLAYQLAGDLYEDPTQDQLVASGFNRLHLIIDVGTALPEESLHKNILDRVAAFGTTFLGLTVQCAQCHDHKYDPISQKEFFQFYAFFNNFDGEPETTRRPERGLQPPFIYLINDAQEQQLAAYDADAARLKAIREAIVGREAGAGAWPENTDVSAPWIWSDPAQKSESVTMRRVVAFDTLPAKARVRFTGLGSAELRLNGTWLGQGVGPDQGVEADVSTVLVPGENLITIHATGDAGVAFVLDYSVDGVIQTLTSDADWEVRAAGKGGWKSATVIHDGAHQKEWVQKVLPENITRLARDEAAIAAERKAFLDTIPAAMVMREKNPPRPATMLIRGEYDAPGEPVERATPEFLPALYQKEERYTRLDLAKWLVAPEHPLTARVAVNRFWQQLFGVGLVKTSEDFGAQGEPPSHPDLLDDLALDFIASGWDVKALMRHMVLSKTYRQSSDASPEEFRDDPENRLLARGARYRMDAEMVRDQILAVSGQLNPTLYGDSVKPPQPPGLWEMVSMAEPKTYVADEGEKIYRRSLYTYWRRGMPPPQMTIMNAPSREFCVARRERTNTPLQSLLLMNEQEYFKAAQACVEATVTPGMNREEGLRRIYEKITSQVPSPERLQLMATTLEDFKGLYEGDPALAALVVPASPDLAPEARADRAAWTMVTHSLLNIELAKVRR